MPRMFANCVAAVASCKQMLQTTRAAISACMTGARGLAAVHGARHPASMADPLILLVEDDSRLRDLLQRYLESQALRVRAVANLAGMRAQLAQHHVDLIVLDLMLPDGDGLAACRDLRAAGEATPILILTARGDDVDRIIGLEIGADDYLPKPCNPRELLARIRAILRRQRPMSAVADAEAVAVRFGDCVVNPAQRTLFRHGEEVRLTTGEFALLWVLLQHPRRPLSRDQLLNLARGRDHEGQDRAIDVMLSRLRKLVEPDPRTPRYLQTVWGHGYMFVPDAEA